MHYSEFLAATLSTKIQVDRELLETTFQRFDKSGTGFIEKHDLKSVLGDAASMDEIDDIIGIIGSSASGKINCEEFIDFAMADEGKIANVTDRKIDVERQSSGLIP